MTRKEWIANTIIANVVMGFLYVLADYYSWMWIRDDLQPLYDLRGISIAYANVYYTVFFRQVQIAGATSSTSFAQGSYLLNLPLLIFIATIILNMFLVIRMTKQNTKS
jgi:hypothetical protein